MAADCNARILIVEDDESIATGLALNLKIAGYVPSVAHDGELALELISDNPPDLVLLDINLPKLDGMELIGEVRDAGIDVPIVMVSAREDEYDKVANTVVHLHSGQLQLHQIPPACQRHNTVVRLHSGQLQLHQIPPVTQQELFS